MQKFLKQIRNSLLVPLLFVGILYIVETIKYSFDLNLSYGGIRPRSLKGIIGIVFSPLIHSDLTHLISNTLPLFTLITFLFFFYTSVAFKSLVRMYFLTGILVWLFARGTNFHTHNSVYHIGASGIVYALASFIFFTGAFSRRPPAIVLSLIMILFYSSMLIGIFPFSGEHISWESHLFGVIAGAIVAWLCRKEAIITGDEPKEIKQIDSSELNEPNEEKNFFPTDIFEQTKEERKANL